MNNTDLNLISLGIHLMLLREYYYRKLNFNDSGYSNIRSLKCMVKKAKELLYTDSNTTLEYTPDCIKLVDHSINGWICTFTIEKDSTTGLVCFLPVVEVTKGNIKLKINLDTGYVHI